MTYSEHEEPLLRFDFRSITAADIPGPTAGPEELHRFAQRLRGQYPMPRSVQWRQVLARPEDWGLLACGSALFAWNRRHHFGFGDEPAFDNRAQFLSVRGVVRRMGEVLAALEGRGAPLTDDDWAKADVDGMWNEWEAPLIAAAEAERREYERLSRLPTERRATVDGLQIVATVRWLDHGGPELRVVQDDRLVVKGRVMLPGDMVGRFVLGEVSAQELVSALRERHLLPRAPVAGPLTPKRDDPSA